MSSAAYPPVVPDLDVELDVAAGRALVALVSEHEAEAIVREELEAAERRRLERETQRAWPPSWRCDRCSGYVSSATAACPRCGHVGASNTEGALTSYDRAHERRRRRLSGRRR